VQLVELRQPGGHRFTGTSKRPLRAFRFNPVKGEPVKQKLAAATFVIGFCGVISVVFAYDQDGPDRTLAEAQYLPGYTADGDSILPKNFHLWVYVGSPLTPNSHRRSCNFPQYHNVRQRSFGQPTSAPHATSIARRRMKSALSSIDCSTNESCWIVSVKGQLA
jgi:hypothetical protein